jgi:hypothetical protein
VKAAAKIVTAASTVCHRRLGASAVAAGVTSLAPLDFDGAAGVDDARTEVAAGDHWGVLEQLPDAPRTRPRHNANSAGKGLREPCADQRLAHRTGQPWSAGLANDEVLPSAASPA